MTNYLVTPTSNVKGGILLLHAWWGLNDFFKGLCERLAAEGYLILAPDLYHGQIARTIPEAENLRRKLTRKIATKEIPKALAELQSQPALTGRPIGLIGFSLGAHWALWLAKEKPKEIAATVLFYGTRGGEYNQTDSAFLGHFAETDEYESASGVKKLEKTLKTAGKDVTFYHYPNTGHWFFESDQPAYNPEAANLAWTRTLDYLGIHFG
jgi:carboxymethylenebutenolidase